MKKRITVGVLLLFIISPTISFGETNVNNINSAASIDGTKVATVGDVFVGVGKNILYQVGSQVLQKYTNPTGVAVPTIPLLTSPLPTTTPTTTTSTVSTPTMTTTTPIAPAATTTAVTTPSTAVNGGYIPGQTPAPEPMIPISH
jgi:hypothetical protein